MSVEQYWQERLVARNPLADHLLRVEGYNVKSWSGKYGEWPRAVARQALYQDYETWHIAWREAMEREPWFAEQGIRPPEVLPEFQFRVAIGPWLYIDGKEWHVKNYNVQQSSRVGSEWVKVKTRRYFIRLREVERHIEAFERVIGRSIRTPRERLVYT